MSLKTKINEFLEGFRKGAPPEGHGGSAQSPTSSGGDLGTMPNATGMGTADGDAPKQDGR